MKVFIVYELHWGNTAAVAQAIADGFGPEAQSRTTDEVSPADVADADLIVAGAPVMAFGLPGDRALATLTTDKKAPTAADVSHPSMRTWLEGLPTGRGRHAEFETGFRWSPGGATGAIGRALDRVGFRRLAKGRRFVVTGSYGPLRDGELERARRWGGELAAALSA